MLVESGNLCMFISFTILKGKAIGQRTKNIKLRRQSRYSSTPPYGSYEDDIDNGKQFFVLSSWSKVAKIILNTTHDEFLFVISFAKCYSNVSGVLVYVLVDGEKEYIKILEVKVFAKCV